MKLIEYEYIDGQDIPPYIKDGGYLYHIKNNKPYLVGVANDSYQEISLNINDLFSFTSDYVDLQTNEVLSEEKRWDIVNELINQLKNRYEINI